MRRHLLTLALTLAAAQSQAQVSVVDAGGRTVALAQPARRVVAMSPHATEMLFAAGAGARVVGVVKYSDFPAAASKLPQVGDSNQIDIEQVIALKPDLLVVWQSGNTARQLEQLRRLGIPMFYSEPQQLEQVASDLDKLGQLMGTQLDAGRAATRYRAAIATLKARYAARPPVKVFYQVWSKPLFTLGGKQIVNDVITLCGGVNVFAASAIKAPQVDLEAVLAHNPEAVFAGQSYDPSDPGVTMWQAYPGLLARQRGNLFTVQAERLSRPGPRLAEGAAELCEKLELARQRRAPASR